MQHPKCIVSLAQSLQQLPLSRTIETHLYNHQIEVLLPSNIGEVIASCHAFANLPKYHRLVIPLGAILEASFFETFIKAGDVILLSQGRLEVDNIFNLSNGILRLSVDNESYEKAGLQGRPTKFGNGPGAMKRRRFLVEINLRSPSYQIGTKTYNKLLQACTNVFNKPVVFLFADLSPETTTSPVEILSNFPVRTAQLQNHSSANLQIPSFILPKSTISNRGNKAIEAKYNHEVCKDWAMDVYEYLSLLQLPGDRPADRIGVIDSVDPFLSTYCVGEEKDGLQKGDVTSIRVSGLLTANWVGNLWGEIEALIKDLEDREENWWVSLTAHSISHIPVGWNDEGNGGIGQSGDSFTVLKLSHQNSIMYELIRN